MALQLGPVDLDELHAVPRFVGYTTQGSLLGVWPQLNPAHSTVGHPRGCHVRKCERYCTSSLDTNPYPLGVKVTEEQYAAINLRRADFHGDWNYTIKPSSA